MCDVDSEEECDTVVFRATARTFNRVFFPRERAASADDVGAQLSSWQIDPNFTDYIYYVGTVMSSILVRRGPIPWDAGPSFWPVNHVPLLPDPVYGGGRDGAPRRLYMDSYRLAGRLTVPAGAADTSWDVVRLVIVLDFKPALSGVGSFQYVDPTPRLFPNVSFVPTAGLYDALYRTRFRVLYDRLHHVRPKVVATVFNDPARIVDLRMQVPTYKIGYNPDDLAIPLTAQHNNAVILPVPLQQQQWNPASAVAIQSAGGIPVAFGPSIPPAPIAVTFTEQFNHADVATFTTSTGLATQGQPLLEVPAVVVESTVAGSPSPSNIAAGAISVVNEVTGDLGVDVDISLDLSGYYTDYASVPGTPEMMIRSGALWVLAVCGNNQVVCSTAFGESSLNSILYYVGC